jgi:hypothetical protein
MAPSYVKQDLNLQSSLADRQTRNSYACQICRAPNETCLRCQSHFAIVVTEGPVLPVRRNRPRAILPASR